MKKKDIAVSGGLRTSDEQIEASLNKECFDSNPSSWEDKMQNFPKYIRRQNLTRLIALYEIFKLSLDVKGSIVECGVNQGFGVMTWAKLSAILEPTNLTRRIYGFDTFEGFPGVSDQDLSPSSGHVKAGDLAADTLSELEKLTQIYDSTRFLGHVDKVKFIKGDANETIPDFISENPHLMISLLYLDFDLYEPTKTALENFLPLMNKGGIVAFDELDNPLWPGETKAMFEFLDKYDLKIKRLPFDPYIGYSIIS